MPLIIRSIWRAARIRFALASFGGDLRYRWEEDLDPSGSLARGIAAARVAWTLASGGRAVYARTGRRRIEGVLGQPVFHSALEPRGRRRAGQEAGLKSKR